MHMTNLEPQLCELFFTTYKFVKLLHSKNTEVCCLRRLHIVQNLRVGTEKLKNAQVGRDTDVVRRW